MTRCAPNEICLGSCVPNLASSHSSLCVLMITHTTNDLSTNHHNHHLFVLTCARRVQSISVHIHQIHHDTVGPAKAQLHHVLATRTMRAWLQTRVLQILQFKRRCPKSQSINQSINQ